MGDNGVVCALSSPKTRRDPLRRAAATGQRLTEAIAMYERSGYRHIERYNDNPYAEAWFEKDLTPAPR